VIVILCGCGKEDPFAEDVITDVEAMRELLDDGLDPNTYNDTQFNQDSLLCFAVRMKSLPVARLLIDRGADVDLASKGLGKSPLFQAAYQGDVESVSLLIKAGCNVNHIDLLGNNALREAIIAGHHDIVRLLLQGGADPQQENNDGQTMNDLAAELGDAQMKKLLGGGEP
jgi:ankyrin repeat protein